MYVELSKSPRDGQWYWHLVAANNKVIAQGEGYTTKAAAIHGIQLVIGDRNIPIYER